MRVMVSVSAMAVLAGSALAGAPDNAAVITPPALFQAAASTTPADNLPNRPGKDKLVAACGGCHQPDIVIGQQRDAEGWREVVDQMVARGATVQETDYEQIITYLAAAQ